MLRRTLSLVYALSLVVMLPIAPLRAAVDMDTGARIYEAAAVRDQVRVTLGGMPARLREMFVADAKTPLSDQQLAAITAAAEHGFRIAVFEPAALQALAQNLDADSARKIQAFLMSDVGLRMVADDRALAALDEQSIDKVMSGQLKAPSSPKRDALTDKIERAAHSTESTVEIFTSMGRAVATGAAMGTGADPAEIDAHSRKMAEATRKDMEENMREPLHRYLAYGYRNLSDADLERLLSFLRSKAGMKYVIAYTTALDAGFDAMGKRCGEELGESLREIAQAQAENPTVSNSAASTWSSPNPPATSPPTDNPPPTSPPSTNPPATSPPTDNPPPTSPPSANPPATSPPTDNPPPTSPPSSNPPPTSPQSSASH